MATSGPCLISLALLVLNDWYLKAAWGNWFTGKLSDFAGLFLLALLAFGILPRHKLPITIGISLAFTFWKSPFSESAILFTHGAGLPRFDRVVDYSNG